MVGSFKLAGIVCVTLLSTGCTGGMIVDEAGNSLSVDVPVKIHTCEGDFYTTSSAGVFTFNPYDPNSSAFDEAKHVPEGDMLVTVGNFLYLVPHEYDQLCRIPWNNQPDSYLPCSKDMFAYGYATPTHPPTGPNGERIHDPHLVLRGCTRSDLTCQMYNRMQLTLMLKHFTAKCSLGNIK